MTRTAILLNIMVQWTDTGQLIFHHENAGLFLVVYQHSFGGDFVHIPPLALLLQEEMCNVRECCELSGGTETLQEKAPWVMSGLCRRQKHLGREEFRPKAAHSPQEHCNTAGQQKRVPVRKRHRSLSKIGAHSYLFPSLAQWAEENILLCSHKQSPQHALAVMMLIFLLKIKVNECQEDTDMQ